jgi:NADPH2:quinone reductase
MKFIDIREHGPAENLSLGECDKPIPKRGEILIEVAYAGVNRPDIVQRLGFYPPPPGASEILGLEVSGRVAALGEGVSQWQVGDEVCALCNGGGYAEWVAVPADQALPVPADFTLAQAAALPETFFTVWSNVFDRAGLKAGENFLVHGGSSGIGTTAIQLAKAMGANVYTTAGSDEKCQACETLGAIKAINYREQPDFTLEFMNLTQQHGMDVILDMVGGEYVGHNINMAAMDGRIVNIAYLQGSQVNVNMLSVMLKRLTLTGSTLRPQSPAAKALIAKNLLEKVWPLLAAGSIAPQIYATFTMDEAAQAHALMESSQHIGKILLSINP